jgi:hypothetical protein
VYSYVEDMQFATDPPMGVSVSEVDSYNVRDGYAVLHLQSLPQDTGSLELMVDDAVYDDEEAGFTRYDEVSRTIVVRPDPKILSLLSISHPRVRLISDMKFLIRSVTDFLDRYSELIRLPDAPAPLGAPCFPEGEPPSEEQVSAVEKTLGSGMSYVWGAPGSGKTQYVLATCIRTCVRNGMRVAVFAPTNNSVEQVLRGILKAFPEKDLGGGILRLGVPTKGFLLDHPEMCEDRQAQRRADRIAASIGNLEEVLFERACERVKKDVDDIAERISRMDSEKRPDEDLEAMVAPILSLCSSGNVGRRPGSADLKDLISEARTALYDRDRPALGITEYASMKDSEITGLIMSLREESERISSRCTSRRVRDVSVVAGTPLQFISRFRPKGTADDGRMELDVDRIFVDEAGYCSLMHALALFSNGVPVSFLGDHMQLPPVCEMDQQLILSSMAKGNGLKNAFLWDMNALYCEEILTRGRGRLAASYVDGLPPDLSLTVRSDLTESHRFGRNLAGILDRHVYRNGMRGRGEGDLRILYVDAACQERKDRENAAEAKAVREVLEGLSPSAADTAVLTPYAAQARLLRNTLGRYRDCVMTVHASQGREWKTVVFSVADDGSPSKTVPLRFTSSKTGIGLRIVNTAVSRAKKTLIIVCDTKFWRSREEELITDILKEASPFDPQ